MLIRVVRQLTIEGVLERIKEYESKFDMPFDQFEELFVGKKLPMDLLGVYSEWADLVHAYRGYIEGGELDYSTIETRDLKPQETELLTPKRIELMCNLTALRPDSINDLAQKTKRNVKNVYQDLKVLKALGFVTFRKRGKRNIVPETLIEEITLLVR
jgi:DNA-binding transcriptional ArsR family regulator